MSKTKSNTTVPGPTIRGTYNTYEDRRRRDLVKALGHVVDLELEKLVSIEVGGWGTGLRLKCPQGVKANMTAKPDGTTHIYLTRE